MDFWFILPYCIPIFLHIPLSWNLSPVPKNYRAFLASFDFHRGIALNKLTIKLIYYILLDFLLDEVISDSRVHTRMASPQYYLVYWPWKPFIIITLVSSVIFPFIAAFKYLVYWSTQSFLKSNFIEAFAVITRCLFILYRLCKVTVELIVMPISHFKLNSEKFLGLFYLLS